MFILTRPIRTNNSAWNSNCTGRAQIKAKLTLCNYFLHSHIYAYATWGWESLVITNMNSSPCFFNLLFFSFFIFPLWRKQIIRFDKIQFNKIKNRNTNIGWNWSKVNLFYPQNQIPTYIYKTSKKEKKRSWCYISRIEPHIIFFLWLSSPSPIHSGDTNPRRCSLNEAAIFRHGLSGDPAVTISSPYYKRDVALSKSNHHHHHHHDHGHHYMSC